MKNSVQMGLLAMVLSLYGCAQDLPTGDFYGDGYYLNVTPSGEVYDFKVWYLGDATGPSVEMGQPRKDKKPYQIGLYRVHPVKAGWSLSSDATRVMLAPFDVTSLKANIPDTKALDTMLTQYVHNNYFKRIVHNDARGEHIQCMLKVKGKRSIIKYHGDKAKHIKSILQQLKVQQSTVSLKEDGVASSIYQVKASLEIPQTQTTGANHKWETTKATQTVGAVLTLYKAVDEQHKTPPNLDKVTVNGQPLGSWCSDNLGNKALIKQTPRP